MSSLLPLPDHHHDSLSFLVLVVHHLFEVILCDDFHEVAIIEIF